jgi:ATP synthase protein I
MRIEHNDENRPVTPDDLKTRLKALDTRIGRAMATQETAEASPSPKSDAGALGQALQLSAGFISSVAAGGVTGWGLDWLVGSSPWGLILCLLLGFCAGMLGLLRAAATIKTVVP